jgi:flagellar hook-basal body protein
MQPNDRNIAISADGRVTVNEGAATNTESTRGTIRIASFANPSQLQKEGNNLFSSPAGTAATADTTSRLIQGSIEKSNVNGVVEITRLIEISRSYQQIATLLQQQSELHKNAIQQLANVPA